MSEDLRTAALEYHAKPRPGKISVEVTKPAATSRDLSLAYSPGVAEPDLDGSVRVTDAVAPLDIRPFRVERTVTQAKVLADPVCVTL